ncbi:MAG: thioesterase II family protein [Mycobacterium sp.]
MIDESTGIRFEAWVKRFPGVRPGGATVVFPHAGGAAAAYRTFTTALARNGTDAYLVQYPQRADRLTHPAAATIEDLATDLFHAGDWKKVGPLKLFGHCMGAVVAFEFARIAESAGLTVQQLWASASQAPSAVAGGPPAPTTDRELLADMVDLGGTDPRLLADADFVDLLLPAVRADYQAFNRYSCGRYVAIGADLHTLGGRSDHRISEDMLQEWKFHTAGAFTLSLFDGGHFYVNDHVDAVAQLIDEC